jgi:DNA-binding NarL/FixJ family response regulator
MITLLLVNDEPLVRQGLHMWLDRAPDVTVVGEASSSAEAVPLAQALQPDVVLIDVSTSPMDGFLATTALRASVSRSAVVLLSLHDEAPIRTRAYAAGAAAFVGQQEGAQALLAAIRRVKQQGRVS